MARPLIALAGRIGAPGKVARTSVVYGGRRYFDAVLRAGGLPVMLSPEPLDHDQARELLGQFDGFVLLGGPDVDPVLYGQDPHPTVYGVNRESDEFEITLVQAAIETDLPTLAICRGMQVANVALGGTLHQHLGDHDVLGDHAPEGFPAPPEGILHPVAVEPGSRLAKAIGNERPHGASYHHQAIDQLGEGLVINARSEDGMIEGAEREDTWFVAIQWHPEDTAHHDDDQQHLFDALVEQALARGSLD
jgi:putative glutamine amidotransferase